MSPPNCSDGRLARGVRRTSINQPKLGARRRTGRRVVHPAVRRRRHSSGDVDALRANPIVEAVYLNTRFTTQQAYQTNALYWRRGVQWDMRQIEAHLATTRGTGVRVCVVDGPIAATHRDFAGKVIALAHFPGNASWAATANFSSHGSHVASTVSTNGMVQSVAPGGNVERQRSAHHSHQSPRSSTA